MSTITPFERWWFDAWPHRWWVRRHVPRFLKSCPEPFRGQVLEVGAGSGWTSQRILETFPQVELTATDVDGAVLQRFARLQDRYGRRLHVAQADVYQLPFDRNAFDIVVAIALMHRLTDLSAACLQLLRVLRPGGLLGISGHDFQLPQLEAILTSQGATIEVAPSGRQADLWIRKPFTGPVRSSVIRE